MEIITKKSPIFIVTSDWHLRESQPSCRKDNFWDAQWKKVQQIAKLQEHYNCKVIHAGDLFHNWKASPYLLSYAIRYLPKNFYTIYGNHDLPQHSLDLKEKSAIQVLLESKKIELINTGAVHWGQEITKEYKTLVIHKMIWNKEKPFWAKNDFSSKEILERYKNVKLFICGHNHERFVEIKNEQILINSGCITRQSISEEDFIPAVYLVYENEGKYSISEYILEIEKDVFIKKEEKIKDSNIENLIKLIQNKKKDLTINFEYNLKKFLEMNNVSDEIKTIIEESLKE